jgi:hypothetical protein
MSALRFRDDARTLLLRRLRGLIKSPAMFRELENARLRHRVEVDEAQRVLAELMREGEAGAAPADVPPPPPLFASAEGRQ